MMSTHALPRRSAGISGRVIAVLGLLSVAFGAAFVVAPRFLAATARGGGFRDQQAIIDALRVAFVDYWDSGSRNYPASLQRLVDYWIRYHIAKAVTAALLTVVLSALGIRLWRMLLAGGSGRVATAVLGLAWALVSVLGLFGAVVAAVNIHGAIYPFSSLVSMLPLRSSDRRFADTVGQIRHDLVVYRRGDVHTPPPLEVIISDYARYHGAMAVLATVMLLVLVGMSVGVWRRFATAKTRTKANASSRRERRLLASFGVLLGAASLALAFTAVANVSTATDPIPGLSAFFDGG